MPEFLYQHWTDCPRCSDGATLLYDGVTNSPDRRSDQHASKVYWPAVRVITVETMWGMTREQVEQEETRRIRMHRAPFNERDNPDYDRLAFQRARILRSANPEAVSTISWWAVVADHVRRLAWRGGKFSAAVLVTSVVLVRVWG